jgi:deoxycytidylate deaminase
MIVNAGIEKIVFEEGYTDKLAEKMLKESRIKVKKFDRKKAEDKRGKT